MKLAERATLIRRKNAGPFFLTFDILFDDEQQYQLVKASQCLNEQAFATLYGCPVETVRFFVCDNALAFKFSIPRPLPQGDMGDGDRYARHTRAAESHRARDVSPEDRAGDWQGIAGFHQAGEKTRNRGSRA
jgi:hypothetical protein